MSDNGHLKRQLSRYKGTRLRLRLRTLTRKQLVLQTRGQRQFSSLKDAREKIDDWHWRYNNINPHSGLGMKSPLEFEKEQRQEQEIVLAS